MKKIYGAILAGTLLFSPTAFAGYNGPAMGDTLATPPGPPMPRQAVAMTFHMVDDAPVLLEGYIVNRRRGDHYTFRDRSGETVLEVKRQAWKGLDIDHRDRVRVFGKVDRQQGRTMVEADRIELASRTSRMKGQRQAPDQRPCR